MENDTLLWRKLKGRNVAGKNSMLSLPNIYFAKQAMLKMISQHICDDTVGRVARMSIILAVY